MPLYRQQQIFRRHGVEFSRSTLCEWVAHGATLLAPIAEALRKHTDIRVVIGTGQADTEAAGLAIERYFPRDGYWSAGFDLSPNTLRLIKAGHVRCTVDQQPYIQGFYPVIQLTFYLRYGILPADIDAGATIIDASNVERVIELTKQKYR